MLKNFTQSLSADSAGTHGIFQEDYTILCAFGLSLGNPVYGRLRMNLQRLSG